MVFGEHRNDGDSDRLSGNNVSRRDIPGAVFELFLRLYFHYLVWFHRLARMVRAAFLAARLLPGLLFCTLGNATAYSVLPISDGGLMDIQLI